MNEQTKQWDRKYIKKENSSLAKSLAQKHYYLTIKPVLENNLSELKNLFPGKDVIFTYESSTNPLEISTIRKIVNGIKCQADR